MNLTKIFQYVRESSRQQFMKKALLKKVSLVQQQQK